MAATTITVYSPEFATLNEFDAGPTAPLPRVEKYGAVPEVKFGVLVQVKFLPFPLLSVQVVPVPE
jgi:hypothetical protein